MEGEGVARGELRALLELAGPVVLVQLGLYAMGAVDAAFMGRVSAVEFAALSIGHAYTFTLLGLGMGTLAALDPIVSQAWGARDLFAVGRGVQRGIVLALFLSVGIGLLVLPVETVLAKIGQPPAVIPIAADFARISIAGFPAFLLFVALRQSLQAMHVVRPIVFAIVVANAINVLLDWVLIYGNLGAPALGAVGSAWATVIARWSMLVLLPVFAGEVLVPFLRHVRSGVLEGRALGRMLALGLPIGLQFAIEIGAFCAVLLSMGRIGEVELAGHQVAMSLASASFMVPFAISMAAAVRVGNAIGRGDPRGMRRACGAALATGTCVMLVFGALFVLVPRPLARIFTDLPEVITMALVLIPLAGFFQVFDGVQGVALGCLRGMADTKVPMLIHVLGFWAFGIPFGWWLAFERDLGARGLWWGLVAALALVALVQGLRLWTMLGRGVERWSSEGTEERAESG